MGLMTWLMILASVLAQGEIGSRETLSGSLDGPELRLTVDASGVSCRGYLTDSIDGMGRGSLVCGDGRAGSFSYRRLEDGSGTGYGHIGTEPLVIVLGSK